MGNLTRCRVVIGILSLTTMLRAESFVVTPSDRCVGKILASNRTNEVITVLTNEQGRLAGEENSFCLEFRKPENGGPVDVRSVSVEFLQLVGRIQERPIVAQLTETSVGTYLGQVNLGRQYYNPAAYYAVVRYLDMAGKKRKMRFHVSVKQYDVVRLRWWPNPALASRHMPTTITIQRSLRRAADQKP